jgi:hypothetical protein
VSIRYYHPESFDDDVEIFHNIGLGRGKGLEKILGYDLSDFPELHDKLEKRVRRISEFLSPQPEINTKINELEQELEEERRK